MRLVVKFKLTGDQILIAQQFASQIGHPLGDLAKLGLFKLIREVAQATEAKARRAAGETGGKPAAEISEVESK